MESTALPKASCGLRGAEQLLHIAAVLARVQHDALQPLAPGVYRAIWAWRIQIVGRLDRAAGLIERLGRAAQNFFARQRSVLRAPLLVVLVQAGHPAALLIELERRLDLAQRHQRQAIVRVG